MSDLEAALRQQCEAADALLLGRVTFEQMRAYWPLQTDDRTGLTGYLNDVSKHVVSSTLHWSGRCPASRLASSTAPDAGS